MPVYKCTHIQLCRLCTAMYTPLLLGQTRLMKLTAVVSLPRFTVYHYLECLQVSTYLTLAFTGLSWLAPLPFPFLLFALMDFSYAQELLSGASLSSINAVVPNSCRMGFVPLFWSYEM